MKKLLLITALSIAALQGWGQKMSTYTTDTTVDTNTYVLGLEYLGGGTYANHKWNISSLAAYIGGGGGGANFANTDLTLTGDRAHHGAGHNVIMDNFASFNFHGIGAAGFIVGLNSPGQFIVYNSGATRRLIRCVAEGMAGTDTITFYGAYSFPAHDAGVSGQALTSDALGHLSWSSVGTGTVTTFSAGNASPLFTTNVSNPTTTPALSFTIPNQSANAFWAGPVAGGATTPTFRPIVPGDLPNLTAFYTAIPGINHQTGTTYTLVSGDYGKIVEFSNSSAITLTIPSGLTAPDGSAHFTCVVQQNGTGQITVQSSGTTLHNAHSYTKSYGQYSMFSIIYTNTTDTYDYQGDMQ